MLPDIWPMIENVPQSLNDMHDRHGGQRGSPLL